MKNPNPHCSPHSSEEILSENQSQPLSKSQSKSQINSQSKLKFRCPSCAKLYEAERSDIESSTPQFQCVTCDCRFSFAYPPENPSQIMCSIVDAESHQEPKTCPKCAAISPAGAEECYSCRVIFARLEGLPDDPSLRAQPSLVRKWKLLVDDFDNEANHEDFVRSCQQLDALNFAFNKYFDMKQALGGDALCERMILRLEKLSEVSTQTAVKDSSLAKDERAENKNWKSYIIPGIYTSCALMILWGMINLANRNLIGIGVAVAVLLTGLILSNKGRVNI